MLPSPRVSGSAGSPGLPQRGSASWKWERGCCRLVTPAGSCPQESTARLGRIGLSPGATEGSGSRAQFTSWRRASTGEQEGPPAHRVLSLPAVARRRRQGGPGCQVLLRVLPRPCLVSMQGLPENTSSPGVARQAFLGERKWAAAGATRAELRPGGGQAPPTSRAHPGQGPEEAGLVGKGWRSHPACSQEQAPSILYCLQEASRPLASPRDPLSRRERSPDSRQQVGYQLTADFRKFWVALGSWPMTHPGTSRPGSECAYPKGT